MPAKLIVRRKDAMACLLCALLLMSLTVAQSKASCPNYGFVGFSRYLPGCGGYERVTPGFKAGARVVPEAISSDGSQIVGTSIAVFAGAEGYGEFAETIYHSVWSSTGWKTSAISPPSQVYPAQEFLDFNPNLNKGLWAVRQASQAVAAEDLAVREPNGSFVKVGSMLPPSATEGPPAGGSQVFGDFSEVLYTGASSDLSHVFFQIRGEGPLWPYDTTLHNNGQLSLYEYVGTENRQPLLVGVDDGGRLISDCGTSLGSDISPGGHDADTYNAVSANGETVYFTALSRNECETVHAPEVNEVYARVGQTHTVAISEPSSADCEACQITGERAAAEFMGASQDGSKALFLTTQELFKGATGANLYEYDVHDRPGHKLIRVSVGSGDPEVQGVARVSEDGSHVYFVAKGALTAGPNAEGGEPSAGGENLYVFERDATQPTGHVSFVATLSEEDQQDWQGKDVRPVQTTPDGRFVVFQSLADLTNDGSSGAKQVYEYDSAREELVRISVGEANYVAGMESADASGGTITAPLGYTRAQRVKSATIRLAISNNGSVVVFESTGGLTKAAKAVGEAGQPSVYEYRSSGGVLSNGEVFWVSGGSGQFEATAWGTDALGEDVFFLTQAPMVLSDRDTQEDIYDARDDGGFPALGVVSDCEKELSCQGTASPAAILGAPESMQVSGGGNVPSAVAGMSPRSRSRSVLGGERLTKALRACRRAHGLGRKRRVCEAVVRKRFGSVKAKGNG